MKLTAILMICSSMLAQTATVPTTQPTTGQSSGTTLQPIAQPELEIPAVTSPPSSAKPMDAGTSAAAPAVPKTGGAAATSAAAEPVRTPTARPTRYRMTPPEIVASALALPQGSTLTGNPLPLATVLSWTQDRRQQIEVVHAYWRLAEAAALYRFALDYHGQLSQFQARPADVHLLPAAVASSLALLREAEVSAVAAQHELAAVAMLPPDAPPPLPADRPHVGPYRTYFDALYGMRPAPPRSKLIDRVLPIRCRAIDGRAAAIEAADDALTAARDAYQAGQSDLMTVLSCIRQGLQQRQVFISSVCRYNQDIADYALALATPGLNLDALVGMLIRPVREPVRPLAREDDSTVVPAGGAQETFVPGRRPARNEPTLAPPQYPPAALTPSVAPVSAWGPPAAPDNRGPTLTPPPRGGSNIAAAKGEPTLAPPVGQVLPPRAPQSIAVPVEVHTEPAASGQPTLAPPQEKSKEEPTPAPTGQAPAKGVPTLAPPQPKSEGSTEQGTVPQPQEKRTDSGSGVRRPVVPVDGPSAAPRPRTVNRPALDPKPQANAMYPALVAAPAAERARQLALALYWDRSLPEGMGQPIGLAECLRARLPAERRGVVDAYWAARQRAAQYQVLVQQAELLEGLSALTTPASPSNSAPTLRLRSAGLATEAALHEAHVALLESQFELALYLGHAGEPAWPVPNAVPYAGPCPLQPDSAGAWMGRSWPMRRLAVTMPRLAQTVQDYADALVQADSARAAASGRPADAEHALGCVSRQTEQTLALLASLTDYNRAIAEYVLVALPPDTPVERIVAALAGQGGPRG